MEPEQTEGQFGPGPESKYTWNIKGRQGDMSGERGNEQHDSQVHIAVTRICFPFLREKEKI